MFINSDIHNTQEVLKHKYSNSRHYVYWLILFFISIVFCALPFVNVEICGLGRAVVRSNKENVILSVIAQGRIERVNIKNNASVAVGDTLYAIDAGMLNAQKETQNKQLVDLEARLHDLSLLSAPNFLFDSLYANLYRQEWFDFKERLNELKLRGEQYEREKERAKEGITLGVVSSYEFDVANDRLLSNRYAISILIKQQRTTWSNANKQIENQIITTRGNIRRIEAELQHYVFLAPISGTIINFNGVKENSFVYAGQNIAEISPDDDLIVECQVLPSEIGFLTKDQKVSLQYDAFNYNQWGLGRARVIDIDKNLSIDERGQPFFIVRCQMTNSTLQLKNAHEVQIKKGMTATARFSITERSLWQLLFDKVDDWFNPKILDVNN